MVLYSTSETCQDNTQELYSWEPTGHSMALHDTTSCMYIPRQPEVWGLYDISLSDQRSAQHRCLNIESVTITTGDVISHLFHTTQWESLECTVGQEQHYNINSIICHRLGIVGHKCTIFHFIDIKYEEIVSLCFPPPLSHPSHQQQITHTHTHYLYFHTSPLLPTVT